MALDLTDAITLSGLVNQNLPAKRWLSKTFFGSKVHDTTQIGVDVIGGSRKLAPFRRAGEESVAVNSDVIQTKYFGPNQISLKIATKAFDLAKRSAGQQLSYADGMKTIDERIAFKLSQDQLKLTNMIYRSIEKMCADALFTGTVNNYDANGNVIETFDMGVQSSHTPDISSDSPWTGSSATILENIDEWADLIGTDAGISATDVVLGNEAAKVLRSNEKVLKQLSISTGLFAQLNPVKREDGVRLIGVTADGIRIWQYPETYATSAGVATPLVPGKYALVISDQIAANVHFGMIEDHKAGGFVGEIFSKTWEEEDPSVQWLKAASAPLAIVEQPDGLVCAKVIA